ncbi:MAG TPA: VOC family protein [Propionibacteriaceae bacterium]|nr:VOC family protein [Propionibacteriaceae bacterium]
MSRVCHFEVHASDPQALIDFYSSVFGWQFRQLGEMEYWSILTTDPETDDHMYHILGGLTRRMGPPPAADAPVGSYVNVIGIGDAQATWDAAIAAGAVEALPLGDIPGVGVVGYLRDPDNNLFGIIQPAEGSMPS